MKPTKYNAADNGLGENESLLDVLLADNDAVKNAGLSHSQIARVLDYFAKISRSSPSTVKVNDVELFVAVRATFRGI